MAANQNVVDELVVKLTLDAEQYKKADKVIVQLVDGTEKKAQAADAKRKKRETEQIKRNKDNLKSVKELAGGLKTLALTVATVLGVGSVGGVVGLLTAFAGMETGLRRVGVGTQLSNRELQAWGATARRLGADAQAGTAAIADLAREQQQFNLTGNAPTIQALQQIGVNAGPGRSLVDILSQAQQIFRQSAPAQQKQIESRLSAQGVNPDLILAIKSETDVREAYTRSFAESTEENKKGLDTLNDAISAVSGAMTAFANTIATAVQPYVAQFGQWASQAAIDLGQFVNKVLDAGGGLDGFMKVLSDEAPGIASNLQALGTALVGLGETALVIVYGLKQLGSAISAISDWIFQHLGGTGKANVQAIGDWVKKAWNDAVQGALGHNPEGGGAQLSRGAAARVAAGELGGGRGATGARTGPASISPQDLMAKLITQYGLTVPQAAAVVANAESESSLYAGAVNPAGGGTGARGLFQWRGPRTAAFQKRYGITPDRATIDQQIEFMMSDPYERSLLMKAISGSGDAGQIGARFNDVFEANGKVGEAAKRATRATQLASQYGGTNGAGIGQQINIQSMSVQANTPQEFVGGITRIATPQNYNSGVK